MKSMVTKSVATKSTLIKSVVMHHQPSWRQRCAALGLLALCWSVAVGPVLAQTAPSVAPSGAPALASPNEYRLGSGDVIRVSVFQNPDLTLESRITEAGIVSYPLLGNVRLGGLSVTAAEKAIADGLRNGNFVKQPQVTLVVLQVRGNQASVLGQVNRPGRYPIEVADMRLSELLATAGGTAPNGTDIVVLTGTRNGQSYRYEVDLPLLFSPGGRDKDIFVLNGDTVWVDRQQVVYIYGEVQRPGPMRLERDLTVLQALATGGGLTQRGTAKGIVVHRKEANGSIKVMEPTMTDKLRDGDVVFVRESLF
jgi:polysaccharide biosynthesis/export protein